MQIPDAKLYKVRDIQTGEELVLLLSKDMAEEEDGIVKLQVFPEGAFAFYKILEELK